MAGGLKEVTGGNPPGGNDGTRKPLTIAWQRLVSNEQTRERCRGTEHELRKAVDQLKDALALLGFEPRLSVARIDEQAFRAAPLESNRIWIAGVPLEDWLGAREGASRCCAACGDADCRTIRLDQQTFEVIPAELIVRAALAAARGQTAR